MKKILFFLLFACALVSVAAQNKVTVNQKVKDAYGSEILVGKCTRTSLLMTPYAGWFQKNYGDYIVDTATCVFIRPLLQHKKFTIFMGTWCGDSQREIPRLLKMLDCCGVPEERVELVMVSNASDSYKQSPQHEEAGKNILRVPTILVEEHNKEIGRIVEYPVVSLEKDMLRILRLEGYVPNYSKQ